MEHNSTYALYNESNRDIRSSQALKRYTLSVQNCGVLFFSFFDIRICQVFFQLHTDSFLCDYLIKESM